MNQTSNSNEPVVADSMNDILEPQPKQKRRSSKSNPNTSIDGGEHAHQEIPILADKNSLATEEPIGQKDRR